VAEHRRDEEVKQPVEAVIEHKWFVAKLFVTAAALIFMFGAVYFTTRIDAVSNERDAASNQKTKAESSVSAAKSTINAQASLANRGAAFASAVSAQCKADNKYREENPTLCVSASNLATATPTPIPGPPGSPATAVQIQAAVNYWFDTHQLPIDYTKLIPFVNNWLAAHPAPSGKPGPSGASGSSGQPGLSGQPGASGSSGQPGLNGTDGASGASGQNGAPGEKGDPGVGVKTITSAQQDNSITLTFEMTDGTLIPIQFNLPSDCPATRTITPPDPGIAGSSGDPTEPYAVCVPS
jgi:hypothetical protein